MTETHTKFVPTWDNHSGNSPTELRSAGPLLASECAGAQVLLVDDNVINRTVATELLNRTGMVVDMAENGRQAVTMVAAKIYGVILMDLQMPVMDGLEAARIIRAQEDHGVDSAGLNREIAILAMSANKTSTTAEPADWRQ